MSLDNNRFIFTPLTFARYTHDWFTSGGGPVVVRYVTISVSYNYSALYIIRTGCCEQAPAEQNNYGCIHSTLTTPANVRSAISCMYNCKFSKEMKNSAEHFFLTRFLRRSSQTVCTSVTNCHREHLNLRAPIIAQIFMLIN